MAAEENRDPATLWGRPSEIEAQTRHTNLHYLRAELEMAETFISAAEKASNWDTTLSNIRNAWVALKTVQEFIEKLALEPAERRGFNDVHGALCLRLANLQLRLQK